MMGFLGIFVPFQYGSNDEKRFTPHALRYAGPSAGTEHWKRSVPADIGLLFLCSTIGGTRALAAHLSFYDFGATNRCA